MGACGGSTGRGRHLWGQLRMGQMLAWMVEVIIKVGPCAALLTLTGTSINSEQMGAVFSAHSLQ